MAINALYDYSYPSRSAQALYGDDILVHLWQKDDRWFAAAATVRVPKAMTWKDFYQTQFLPFVSANPHMTGEETYAWTLVDDAFTPQDDKTLDELGVQHKNTLGFARA
ncbi:phenol hydroxylase subunit P4 [Raineyella fluvialis]|uniref:Phenol hydroxylase n=1 Tax=Raineyella fluvialis TaxID=2662261 RepID=A0A5Q2FCL2_9ACTN|nr:phenol hydroxylase subunit P4 [Raineyella fluvialis]QGF23487.1 phenol hydroxylase [Raineyella fluvialis]